MVFLCPRNFLCQTDPIIESFLYPRLVRFGVVAHGEEDEEIRMGMCVVIDVLRMME